MSRYPIVWDAKREEWTVRIGSGLRRKTLRFASLLEAENYLTRDLCPDEVDAS